MRARKGYSSIWESMEKSSSRKQRQVRGKVRPRCHSCGHVTGKPEGRAFYIQK